MSARSRPTVVALGVVRRGSGELAGVEAAIDKDRSAAPLGRAFPAARC